MRGCSKPCLARSDSLRNITIEADFQRGGVSQFRVITWVGFVGAVTGMRLGGFSITADAKISSIGPLTVAVALERLILGQGSSAGFLVRDVLTNNGTFGDPGTCSSDSTNLFYYCRNTWK
eukprot:m.123864 g.123864  ORF g.123864 m.123864 type:complete len:120 (+) comp37839_c0_seq3:424-783(+)